MRKLLGQALAAFLLCVLVFESNSLLFNNTVEAVSGLPDFFFGVDIAYQDSVDNMKATIDEVSQYSNLVIFGSYDIGVYGNRKLEPICQYAYDKGLYFMIYKQTHDQPVVTEEQYQQWGTHFLGYYFNDEKGGWQIEDNEKTVYAQDASDHATVANLYTFRIKEQIDEFKNSVGRVHYFSDTFSMDYKIASFYPNLKLYTSDFALWWWDYKAGYDVVFAELGQYDSQQHLALARGAATAFNKDFGAIICWSTKTPPFIGSRSEIYANMVEAYHYGAKYVIVYDGNEDHTGSILKAEHKQAMKDFWQYTKSHSQSVTPKSSRVAFVVDADFGFGFRYREDSIWGFWTYKNGLKGEMSIHVYDNFKKALEIYGNDLDVVFQDGSISGYKAAITWSDKFWTKTTPQPNQSEAPISTKKASDATATPIKNLLAISGEEVLPLAAVAFIAASVLIPLVLLRRRTYLVSFAQSGLGPHYDGPVFMVDGVCYDKYGASFWWIANSKHTVEFLTPLYANSGKHYILNAVGGLPFDSSYFTVRGNNTIVGYYNQMYRSQVYASRPNPHRKPFYTP